LRQLGLYSTLDKAEQGMNEHIQTHNPTDTFGFKVVESELDVHSFWFTKTIRNYLPDGTFLDECLTSSYPLEDGMLEEFLGRPAEKVRFKNGDLAEELRGDSVRLVIIGNPPRSPEEISKLKETKWKKSGFYDDYSGDSYYALGVGGEDGFDTHSHPSPTNLFPLRFPVSDEMKNDLEKQYRAYRSHFDK